MHISPYKFSEGLKDGIPIALGYLSVSFGFGVSAIAKGLNWYTATLISLSNVTSAGQMVGVGIIAAMGSLGEMAIAQFITNIRYFLMGISLSQKLDDKANIWRRLIISFGITDEIFAVSAAKKDYVGPSYMYGLILLPVLGWTLGTLLGGVAGELLPASIGATLGIAIYGMFVAIVVPEACSDRGTLLCTAIAIVLSCILYYVPLFSGISGGFAVIICAVIGASVAAIVKPVKEADEE